MRDITKDPKFIALVERCITEIKREAIQGAQSADEAKSRADAIVEGIRIDLYAAMKRKFGKGDSDNEDILTD